MEPKTAKTAKSTHFFTNEQIAQMLRGVAAAYEVQGESFWEVRAYENAAASVEHATSVVKDLWDDGRLGELAGVGERIAGYLDELFRSGEVKHWEKVKGGLPKGMFAFLDVPGVGPKTALRLAKELKIQSVGELREAAQKGEVQKLAGFGEKSEADIIKGIEELERRSERMLLPQAVEMADQIVPVLEKVKGVVRVDVLGSVRRRVATVGDLDLAVAVSDATYATNVATAFVQHKSVARVVEQGKAETSVIWSNNKRVDLRVQPVGSYGSLLQHYTGSKQHNIHLRKIAQERGLSLSEYGIRVEKAEDERQQTEAGGRKTEKRLKTFRTEEELYRFLGMEWIPPELRGDTGEIEAAISESLPSLVELTDIKGDLHLHCNFDLEESHDPGKSSMAEIVQKATALGYEYVVLGNHNPSVGNHTEKQMVELVQRKQRKISQTQEQFLDKPSVRLLNGVEVDILADGKLAMPDEALALLDVVVVSIHSGMRQSREKLTKRVINALKNPHTHILGHPTGRLLNQREGYELDWEQVFATAKKYQKAIEINSFYNRLDLPDTLVRQAVAEGIKLVVNTDAHHVGQMDLMEYGVSVARRGWAEKKDILNTLPWEKLKNTLEV